MLVEQGSEFLKSNIVFMILTILAVILLIYGVNGLSFHLGKTEQETFTAIATIGIAIVFVLIAIFLKIGSRPFYLIVGGILIFLVWPLYVANSLFAYGAIVLILICLYKFLTYKKQTQGIL